MSDSRCCCVFANRIFVARLKSLGRQCKVYIFSQFSQESNSFVQSEAVTVTGLTNGRQCELACIDDFESLLRQLVLTVCCAETVRIFRYNQTENDFTSFKAFKLAEASPRTFVLSNAPVWSTLKNQQLTVYQQSAVHNLKLTCPATCVLHACSVQLIAESEEQVLTLYALATSTGVKFVSAIKGSCREIAERCFLPDVFSTNVCALCVQFENVVCYLGNNDDLEAVLTSALDNTTLACTRTGSLLLFKNGTVTSRCEIHYPNANRIQCITRGGRVTHAVVWSPRDGACVVQADDREALKVVQTFPPSHSVIVGDILGQGYQQVTGFIVGQILSDTLWYNPGGEATAATVSSGLKDTIASLQKQCCVGQTALEKTNRTIAETDTLIENLASALREKNLRGQVQIEAPDPCEFVSIRTSLGLVSIVPLDDRVPPPTLKNDGHGSQTIIMPVSSWAHFYGPRLLLGWTFNKETLGREPDIHVTSPNIAFSVHTALSTDAVTVGACCPLPDFESLPVTVLVDFAVHSCTIDVSTATSISMPSAETVTSLRCQQHRYDLVVESHFVSLQQEWDQLVKDLFFSICPGVYFCNITSSVLHEVNFTLEPSGSTCTKLKVYVTLASQYSALKQWLLDILPDDAGAGPPSDGPSDLQVNVKQLLMCEAGIAQSIVQQPAREYASLRRQLLAAECNTDEAVLKLLHCLPRDYT